MDTVASNNASSITYQHDFVSFNACLLTSWDVSLMTHPMPIFPVTLWRHQDGWDVLAGFKECGLINGGQRKINQSLPPTDLHGRLLISSTCPTCASDDYEVGVCFNQCAHRISMIKMYWYGEHQMCRKPMNCNLRRFMAWSCWVFIKFIQIYSISSWLTYGWCWSVDNRKADSCPNTVLLRREEAGV